MEDTIIRFENVSKQYRLGMIGGTTLREELQRFGARLRHQEDPTAKIGQSLYTEGLKSGDTFWALRDIDLEIARGETLGIIGRNGAGKSTLLKLLCRITAPTTGTISYNGRIASMLEVGTGFHGELTGRENIYLNGAILGMSRAETDAKIDDIIEFSECGAFIDTPVKRYSSGMYVKLAFSVAAFLDAEIMIMDEVLAVGDAAFQQKCLRRMKDLAGQEHRTVLYVSHILPTVSELCSRCIVLDRGRVTYDGATQDAIDYYLEHELAGRTFIDYTDLSRPVNYLRRPVRLLRAELTDRDSSVFYDSEPLLLRMDIRFQEDCDGASFRLEIRTAEGRPVATSPLEGFLSGRAGEEKTILLRYDIPGLVPGRYETKFTFYYRREDDSTDNLECVDGIAFEKKLLRERQLRWDTGHWGNIRLDAPKLLELGPAKN